MKLLLSRFQKSEESTIGELFVNGKFECYTLEDVERETDEPVKDWKIKGETAIPRGNYTITLDYSLRFRRILPRLLNVPGFSGIRIHPGNKAIHTEGCILVGDGFSFDTLTGSVRAFEKLYKLLIHSYNTNEAITITIR